MTGDDLAWGRLVERVGEGRVRREVPLAPLTTFRVGGPAEWLVEARSAEEIRSAVEAAADLGIAWTVIGGGSNLLVSDAGVRGLVVVARGGRIEPAGDRGASAEAGVRLNGLIRWAIARGMAGIETFAGTPGSVGGALAGNAHYLGRSIGERVRSVAVFAPGRGVIDLAAGEMAFEYGRSRVRDSGEVVLAAVFDLVAGADPAALRAAAGRALDRRKRTQPLGLPSAGCVFQNPDPARDPLPEGIPPSAGALIDRAGLKGVAVGGARVSPVHANFIVNEGGATADDIRRLIDRCRDQVARRFGVVLREEIRLLGW